MKIRMHQLILLFYILLMISSSCFCFVSQHYYSSNSSKAMAFSCLPHQSSILLQLKQEFSLIKPVYESEDSYPKMREWKAGSDCCYWNGVSCNKATGHVVSLQLNNSWIHGPFPSNSCLFKLVHLQKLNLAHNDFTGSPIPSKISQLSRLTHLNLSSSFFSGHIPSQIFSLKNLISLDLSYNDGMHDLLELLQKLSQNRTSLRQLRLDFLNLYSKVPESLANLSSLTHLSLSECNLHGEFPQRIFQLPNIQVIELWSNTKLTGSLPEFYSGSKLKSLQLYNTNFKGKLPNSIGNLKSLNGLDISGCNFSGLVPYSIGNLSKLSSLDLSFNHFKGQLPPTIGSLSQLSFLDLSNNNFKGQIPSTLGNLAKISALNLGGNEFSGEFPSSLGNLPHLNSLHLNGNNFSGQIPSSVLGNLTQLNSLDLSDNLFHGSFPISLPHLLEEIKFENIRLTGPIPSHTFSNLTFLYYLDLSHNSLNGVIPSSLLTFPPLQDLYLSNNQFSGLESFKTSNSSQLNILFLGGNKLSGNIPNSIFNLKSLIELDLHSNKLRGKVDFSAFSELGQLWSLDISYNILSLTNLSMNSDLPMFGGLYLSSCNISEFPDFLKSQSELRALFLSDNIIDGPIPKWFLTKGMMNSLSDLSISRNHINGWEEVPLTLPWEELESLDLSSNMLQGPLVVPPMSTKYFFMSDNNLSGKIDPLFCTLRSLQVLDASSNRLGGIIPQCLDELNGSLRVLNLRKNSFTGSIPQIFRDGSRLMTLDLSYNKLIGKIPRSLIKCKNLEVLDLGYNQICDTFPFWLQNLQSLQVLILTSNKFQGPICCAHDFVGFVTLKIMDLSHNNFIGNVPSDYFRNWTSMTMRAEIISKDPYDSNKGLYNDSVTLINKGLEMELVKTLTIFIALDLSNNKFEGQIPITLWSLKSLVMVNLSSNNFNGVIPSSIGNLVDLESLDLSNNKLSGKIPQQLAALTFLGYLDLSHNQLEGPIPQGGQVLTFPDAFEGNLGLCGLPLPKKCEPSIPATNNDDNLDEESDFISGFGWKAVVTGYGCGVVIGMVGGHLLFSRRPDLILKVFGVRLRR